MLEIIEKRMRWRSSREVCVGDHQGEVHVPCIPQSKGSALPERAVPP